MSPARASSPPPARRLVVLGASNVASGLAKIVAAARDASGGPVDVHAAAGHGRSYAMESSYLGVRRGAIRECGLLEAVALAPDLPTSALVTDIGVDLLYGAPPEQMVACVMECVDRLHDAGAHVVVTRLPLHRLDTIGPARYRLFRTMFFPLCRLSLRELGERALAANSEIILAAGERGVACVPLAPEWYGFDPIHIAPRRANDAWKELVGACMDASPSHRALDAPRAQRDAAARQNPAILRGFWPFLSLVRNRHALRDGTTVTLY